MGFYNLTKEQRTKLVEKIRKEIQSDLKSGTDKRILKYFSDNDTYIRKGAYLSIGRIYSSEKNKRENIITVLENLLSHDDFLIRQTAINAAGEIGMKDFKTVEHIFDKGLFDKHHSSRNAVIGSVKKMGNRNPAPVLEWAKKYLHHEDKEIRREICHGIELRGREHPEDILPLLKELQSDKTARVRNTLIHVIGQISYKKGCLEKVVSDLQTWENKELVKKALDEIIDVHERYKNFSYFTQAEAVNYIGKNYKP
jgi:hypothetical protein